jgi:biotin carboxyl carrier protein
VSEQEKFSQIKLESGIFETRVTEKFQRRKPYEKHDPRIIKALIPGAVAAIETTAGKSVIQGDTLMILEAMKMLNRIKAPLSGTIKAVRVTTGEKVIKGQVLIEIE